jgi:hypothetical protein
MLIRRSQISYLPYETITDIQSNTPWEEHGLEGDPAFLSYDKNDHELHDGSWPNFDISKSSMNVVDRGTESLPDSLTNLLEKFGIQDQRNGTAFDIGRYELSDR